MKINGINRYQQGGPAPAHQGGEDPADVLMQGAQQALQSGDCNVAMQVCQMIVEMMGGGAPQGAPEQAPAEPAPAEPVYRRGGTLVRRLG
ncbi:MAG: hypothetical protein HUJ56_01765 [Erysipelotrichaceae bacterium]|nr:hypothetical protein [Erysipelotrichaceae bacterium]